MSETTTALATVQTVFATPASFEEAQRVAKLLCSSDLVPPAYREGAKGVANCVLALDIARQLNMSPFTVMQNLQIVEGQPVWKTTYLIERFAQAGIEPEYEFQERGQKNVSYDTWTGPKGDRRKETKTAQINDRACRFKCQRSGKESAGPWVSLESAIKEGWYFRNGSKWPTMPEKMLMIAAAREYNKFYPVVPLNSIKTEDELVEWDEPGNNAINNLNAFAEGQTVEADDAQIVDDEELI